MGEGAASSLIGAIENVLHPNTAQGFTLCPILDWSDLTGLA
jgi:hypothetical protein